MPQTLGSVLEITVPELSDQANIVTALQHFYYGTGTLPTNASELYATEFSIGGYIQQLFTDKANLISPSFTTPALGVATATSINGTSIPTSKTLLTTDAGSVTNTMLAGSISVTKLLAGTNNYILKVVDGVPTWVDFTQAGTIENANLAANITGGSAATYNVLYQSDVDTTSKLAPNTTGTIKYLSQVDSGVPAWSEITQLSVDNSSIQSLSNVLSVKALGITNAMLAGSIADSKLSTISTAGKVSNSATTATNVNTASAIVARDASGNFSAGTVTATLTGNVTGDLTGTASKASATVHYKATTGGDYTAVTPTNKIFTGQTQPTSGMTVGDIWMW